MRLLHKSAEDDMDVRIKMSVSRVHGAQYTRSGMGWGKVGAFPQKCATQVVGNHLYSVSREAGGDRGLRKRSERSEQVEPGKIHRRVLPSVSGVYWGIGTTFTLVLLIFGVLGFQWSLEYRDRHSTEQKEASTQTIEQPTSYRCAVTIMNSGFACRAVRKPGTSERDKAEQYDLRAQQEMAEWAFAMMLIAAASVWIGVAGVAVVGWTLHETRQMTLATREIGESQSKAYVNVSKAETNLVKVTTKINITQILAYLTNTGSTPAIDIVIGGEVIIYDKSFTPLGTDREICRAEIYPHGIVDLPPNSDPQRVAFSLPNNVAKTLKESGFNALASVYLRFEGNIRYWDVFENRYLTEFIFECLIQNGVAFPGMIRSSEPVECYKKIESRN